MEEEISALMKNETWKKCELPKGKKKVDANGCSISNIMQMEPLNATKLG